MVMRIKRQAGKPLVWRRDNASAVKDFLVDCCSECCLDVEERKQVIEEFACPAQVAGVDQVPHLRVDIGTLACRHRAARAASNLVEQVASGLASHDPPAVFSGVRDGVRDLESGVLGFLLDVLHQFDLAAQANDEVGGHGVTDTVRLLVVLDVDR